jgi:hypothetical protein
MRAAAGVVAVMTAVAAVIGCSVGCSAGSNTVDDPGSDAEAGAPPLEDGAIPDPDGGAADSAKDAVAPGTAFCKTLMPAPKFCDDFEDGDLDDDWTSSAFVPGSVAELDSSEYASSPPSFHVATKPIVVPAAGGNALLRSTTITAVNRLNLSFAVRLPKVTFTKGTVAIASVDVSQNHFFALYLRDPDVNAPTAILEEYVAGVVTRHVLAKLPPVNMWTRVVIDLDLTGGKASVTFGSEKALDAEPITVLAGSEATVRLGAIIDGPADAFEARYDDVVIDF